MNTKKKPAPKSSVVKQKAAKRPTMRSIEPAPATSRSVPAKATFADAVARPKPTDDRVFTREEFEDSQAVQRALRLPMTGAAARFMAANIHTERPREGFIHLEAMGVPHAPLLNRLQTEHMTTCELLTYALRTADTPEEYRDPHILLGTVIRDGLIRILDNLNKVPGATAFRGELNHVIEQLHLQSEVYRRTIHFLTGTDPVYGCRKIAGGERVDDPMLQVKVAS